MQSQWDKDRHQRRPSYESRSRVPSGLSPVNDISSGPQSQTQAQQPQQHSASTSSSASQQAKLDGVLYHFYTTTANLIIQSRLSLYRRRLLQSSSDPFELKAGGASTAPIKTSKWFALQIPDTELFKEELRFWRSITSMLDLDASGKPSPSTSVPDLVIEVILDLSRVPGHHQVLLVKHAASAQPPHFVAGFSTRSLEFNGRASIDGRDLSDQTTESSRIKPKLIVLEQWRLRFQADAVQSPPELPTLYKRSIAHFRSLFSLLHALPANRLCAKIDSLHPSDATKQSVLTPVTTNARSFPSLSARNDIGSFDAEMQIGCRLSMGGETDLPDKVEGEFSIQDALVVESDPGLFLQSQFETAQDTDRSQHFAHRSFSPIVTPIGRLHMSVSFRKLADYTVEDAESLRSASNMRVEMDEDYFRPSAERPEQSPELNIQSLSPGIDTASIANAAPSVTGGDALRDSGKSATNRLLLSGNADQQPGQRIGGITAGRLSGAAAPSSSPTSAAAAQAVTETPAPSAAFSRSESVLSRSPAPPSVFSTSVPGRNAAGLSSLRRTASIASNHPGSSGAGILPNPTPSSPALAAALSTEPAFIAPGSLRRTSGSERRLRSLSGIPGGQASPPLSPSSTNIELPDAAANTAPRSVSSTIPSSSLSKPSYNRLVSAGSLLGNTSQSRSGASFSPSSPSPLAQQMSLQAGRSGIGGGGAFASISGSRLSSSPGMRASMAGSTTSGPSLRSVFQSYVPRSPTTSASSFSRTPPTSINITQAPAQSSYSPSNLGTGQRSTSIRRYSNASDVGSGSAFGTSSAAAAASAAARPQMIKRYSTNFSYRQNRDRQSTYGSSLGSDVSNFGGAGREPSSYPHAGATGGSVSSAYGRSWISRIEQKQGLGSGGAFVRTSSLDDATGGTGSFQTRSPPATGHTPTDGTTPSPRSHDDDMDDLMRLLDSKPVFGAASSTSRLGGGPRAERRAASALGSTPEEGLSGDGKTSLARTSEPRENHEALATTESQRSSPGSSQPNLGVGRQPSVTGSRGSFYPPIRTMHPLSRSQVDEMLNRMAESVGIMSLTNNSPSMSSAMPTTKASTSRADQYGADLGRASESQPASAPPHLDVYKAIPSGAARLRPSIRAAFEEGSSGASSSTEPSRSATPNVGLIPTSLQAGGFTRSDRTSMIGTGQIRGLRSSAVESASDVPSASLRPRAGALGLTQPSSGRTEATAGMGMHEYEAEGDLMFADVHRGYDPEDDLPGRMEMMPEEEEVTAISGPTSRRASVVPDLDHDSIGTRRHYDHVEVSEATGGVEGGRGATLPAGAHRGEGDAPSQRVRSGPLNDWQRAERLERERMLEAERRRADAEMSRNFGQEVGASTRGRGSQSPWRASAIAPSTSLSSNNGGFRSSSTRRGVGVGVGLGTAGMEQRRGYGVSAPSTHQFHYQPSNHPSRQSSNSYPVSRDEMLDDDEDAEDDVDR